MTAPTEQTPPADPAASKAPAHLVELLAKVVYVPVGVDYPPNSEQHTAACRAQAVAYADRIWAEAWHAGAAWGAARAPFKTTVATADLDPAFLEEMAQRAKTAQQAKTT